MRCSLNVPDPLRNVIFSLLPLPAGRPLCFFFDDGKENEIKTQLRQIPRQYKMLCPFAESIFPSKTFVSLN